MFSRFSKLFRPEYNQNVIELFKPVYTLLSLTGLFPYSIRFPKGKNACKITRQPSILNILCGIFMFLYVCSYFAFSIINVSFTEESVLTETNYIIELLFVLMCSVTSYYCVIWYRKVHMRVIRRIAFVWTDLSNVPNCDVNPILSYLRKLLAAPLIFLLLIAFPIETLLAKIDLTSFWEHWYLVLPEAVPTLVLIYYNSMILMVVGLLKSIKNHCQTLVLTKGQSSMPAMKMMPNSKDNFRILKHLEKAYFNALEAKKEINQIFQAPMAIITAQCFHGIICELHTMYHELIITRHFELFWVLDRSYDTLYSFAKIFMLTASGSLLKNEVIQLAHVLHSIPIQTHNQDLYLLMQIKHFSTLISFHGADISIYGFFNLDSTLLFNMVASIASYLIILVQIDG